MSLTLVTFILSPMFHKLMLLQQLSLQSHWVIEFSISYSCTVQTAQEMFAEQKAPCLLMKQVLSLCMFYLGSYISPLQQLASVLLLRMKLFYGACCVCINCNYYSQFLSKFGSWKCGIFICMYLYLNVILGVTYRLIS